MRASQSGGNGRASLSGGARRTSAARISEAARLSQEDNLLDTENGATLSQEEVAAAAAAEEAAGVTLLEPRHAPPKEALGPTGAVHVKVTAHVMSLSDIDSREQQFECLLWLQLEWHVRLPPDNPAVSSWRPELTVLNMSRAVSDSDPSFRAVAEGPAGGYSHCFLAYTIHGVFLHRFQLRAFPFDTQSLRIQTVLWRSPLERVAPRGAGGYAGVHGSALDTAAPACQPFRGRVTFSSDAAGHVLYPDGFVQSDVWSVHAGAAVQVRAGHTDERHRSTHDGQRFSTLTVEVAIKRRFEFYLLNVVFPFVLFVCLSFISFAVEIPGGTLTDRAQITLSMVLTAAAFKIVIAGFTPAVGYLTLMDLYVLLCFCFMTAVAVCNVIVSMAPDEATARLWNWHLGVYLAVAWAGAHGLLPLAKWRSRRAHAREEALRDAADAADARRWGANGLSRRTSLRMFAASAANSVSSFLSGDSTSRRSLDGVRIQGNDVSVKAP